MKKFLAPIIIAAVLLLLAGGVFGYLKFLESSKVHPDIFAKPKPGWIIKARKDDRAQITLLNYAFWTLNKHFDFIPPHRALLKRIVEGYREAGDQKTYEKLMKRYEDYKRDTIETGYVPAPPAYDYDPTTWLKTRELVVAGEYDRAVKRAGIDPYALSLIADQRPDLTADMQDLVDKRSPDYWHYYAAVAAAYVKDGQFTEAEGILTEYIPAPYPGAATVPLVAEFLKDKRYIDAIDLACQTAEFQERAEAFLVIAQGLPADYGTIDQATLSRLEASLKK